MRWQPTESETAPHEDAAREVVRLLALMARLRGPGGCPWDRKQTHESLRPYLLEETHEVLEAIDLGDDDDLQEELGDLLLQVVFHAELAREDGRWSMSEVAAGITDKLHFRHPHVFGGDDAPDAEAALSRWEQRKAEEKAAKGKARKSVIDGVPKAAPALMRAERVTDKAASVGFDWPDRAGVRAKVDEELGELDDAIAEGDRAAIEHELGDLPLHRGQPRPVAQGPPRGRAAGDHRALLPALRSRGGDPRGPGPEAGRRGPRAPRRPLGRGQDPARVTPARATSPRRTGRGRR